MAKQKQAGQKERALAAMRYLEEKYPQAECALRWQGDPWRLLVMGRLSAQCTDARINEVCRTLFSVYPDCAAMADAELPTLEKLIYSCGVYRVKAQNLRDSAQMLMRDYGGKVPGEMEALLKLPGVGRKIANLILGDAFGQPAIVADTHCIRISNRLGLCDGADPTKVESTLRGLIPPECSSDFCHRLVLFGREVCTARAPRCKHCPLQCPARQEAYTKEKESL